jgi:TIM21
MRDGVVAGAVLWAVVKELIIEPKEYTAFNMALERLRDDPRVTVRLGTPISGYGQESRNRAARQRIPNRIQVDQNGVEHVQVWFEIAPLGVERERGGGDRREGGREGRGREGRRREREGGTEGGPPDCIQLVLRGPGQAFK